MNENVSGNTRNKKIQPTRLSLVTKSTLKKSGSAPNSRTASPLPNVENISQSMEREPTNNEILAAIRKASQEQGDAIRMVQEQQAAYMTHIDVQLKEFASEFRARIEKAETNVNYINVEVNELRRLNQLQEVSITDLQTNVSFLQQKDVSHKILVFGAPRAVEPTKLIESLAQTINVNIKSTDIAFCVRLKRNSGSRPPIILVGFINHNIAENFVATQKKFGPVAIDQIEGLTKAEEEPATIRTDYFLTHHFVELLKKAKTTKEKLNYKYVWYKHAAIYLKEEEKSKPIRIDSVKNLTDLESEKTQKQ
jgi:hypothetical protein